MLISNLAVLLQNNKNHIDEAEEHLRAVGLQTPRRGWVRVTDRSNMCGSECSSTFYIILKVMCRIQISLIAPTIINPIAPFAHPPLHHQYSPLKCLTAASISCFTRLV